jgi:hypothetical protein
LSSAVAALIAHVVFWIVLALGWLWEDLGPRQTATFAGLWLAGFFGLPHLPYGADLFPSFVALLDVILVILVFKGDVHLT